MNLDMKYRYIYILNFNNGKLIKININDKDDKLVQSDSVEFIESLGYKLSEIAYMLSNENYEINYISDKFKHGDKVLYRKNNDDTWKFGIFDEYACVNDSENYMYSIIGVKYLQEECVLLNVNTWNLLGTKQLYIE